MLHWLESFKLSLLTYRILTCISFLLFFYTSAAPFSIINSPLSFLIVPHVLMFTSILSLIYRIPPFLHFYDCFISSSFFSFQSPSVVCFCVCLLYNFSCYCSKSPLGLSSELALGPLFDVSDCPFDA